MDFLIASSASSGNAMVSLPEWLELASIFVGSMSGLLVARERKLDLVGFFGLALLCGLGGGLIRDMMMQRGGVYMLDSPFAIGTALAAAIVVFLFPQPFSRHPHILEWVDILAVGLFAVMGTDKAVVYGLNPLAVILMGTITGIGGGMLRDVFLGEVPRIFQRSNFYAICAVAGSAEYWFCVAFMPLDKGVAAIAGIFVTVALRRLSLHFDVKSPADVDFGPQVSRPIKAIQRHSAHDLIAAEHGEISPELIAAVRRAIEEMDGADREQIRERED